jgi:threonylcarbamoyladenosine tRNA methylthiotransferase MtaB
MRYSVITFGCRVNQADSLGFEEALRARKAVAAECPEQADLVIINTCSVTASADQSARQTARRLARLNPKARIVITGCSATRQPDTFRPLPNVLRVVPNDDKPRLVSLLSSDFGLGTADRFGDGDGGCGAVIEPGVAGRTAFTLRVQTGCAQPCAYCIIPTTRGAPRSVPLEAVLAEVHRVVQAGFKEIALTGVHLGSYGRDLSPPSSLFELLQALERAWAAEGPRSSLVPGLGVQVGRSCAAPTVRFRISSLEPMDCTPEIVELVGTSELFAPHLHLPLQHASNRVLMAMRRPYTIEQYARLVDQVRFTVPAAAIGSDIIVGFPGESDQDFEELDSYLEGSPLTHLHVFPYSDRPGTSAAAMPDKVPGPTVRERSRRIREISEALSKRFRAAQIGTIHRALTLEDGALAVTGNYIKVMVPPGRSRNEWVRVQVTETGEGRMRGQVV